MATNLKNSKSLGNLVSELAQVHNELWEQEDKARSKKEKEVVSAKRQIDVLNQRRNDLIERIDEFIVNAKQVSVE